jgi:hypothetical protein
MKFLLHQLLLLKVEKKIQKIIQEKKYKHLYTQSNLSQSYTHWAFSDYQQLAEIINSNTIIGGGKISASTLQRISGVRNTPKKYTLKNKTKRTICLFLGYDTWESLTNYLMDLIIENIELDENLRTKIGQIIVKKIS